MNENLTQQTNLLQFLQTLVPFLSSDMKKEVKALVDLFTAFQVTNAKDLAAPILDIQKKLRKSPEGIVARVKEYLAAKENNTPTTESVEELASDYRKLSAASIKTVAKQLDLNLADKKDEQFFVNWLQTGVKPPTQEERLQQELQNDIDEVVKLHEEMELDLKTENIEKIINVAESVYKKYKLDGLKHLVRALHEEPVGKTKKAIVENLRGSLKELLMSYIIIRESK